MAMKTRISILQKEALAMGLRKNTKIAYRQALNNFVNAGFKVPATVDDVISYLSLLNDEEMALATIKIRLAGISYEHKLWMKETGKQMMNPCADMAVHAFIVGLNNTNSRQLKQAFPLSPIQLETILSHIQGDKKGLRDKAMLAVGYFGCLRRGELVGIRIEDVRFDNGSLIITLPKTKTSTQPVTVTISCNGIGRSATESTRALLDQLKDDGINSGDLFLSIKKSGKWGSRHIDDENFNKLIKFYAEEAGLAGVTSHSLRAGLATHLSRKGVSIEKIMRHGRWKNASLVIDRYIRPANIEESATFGLT